MGLALSLLRPMGPGSKAIVKDWAQAVLQTPQIFRRLAFRKRTLEEELQQALLRGSMRKAFGGFDLWMLGLGLVVATGWATLTGSAAQQYAGPSIVISYLFSGLAALTSACCFAELCAEFPVSGGAFSYIMVTFGEFPAFVTLASLLLEYALGMAATARGFSLYLNSLLNLSPGTLIININDGAHTLDPLAAAIVLLMSVLLSLGVRESAWFISGVGIVKIALLLLVTIAGYTQGSWGRMTPFVNYVYDADSIFLGAAVVFFTQVGFDAIANAAEEVKDSRDLPWAIVGTVGVSTCLYVLLALSLALMVYDGIACPNWVFFLAGNSGSVQERVSFLSAFVSGHCMAWMQYIISVAALLGVVTALTVGLFSLSRIVMAAARDWLLPPFLAKISPRTQTPLVAQMSFGVIIALLAMLVEVDAATSLVSFGTLIVLWLVCNAQLYRRYFPDIQMHFTQYGTVELTGVKAEAPGGWAWGRRLSINARRWLVWGHMAAINGVSIALAIYYSVNDEDFPAEQGPPPEPPPAPVPHCDASVSNTTYAEAYWRASTAAVACQYSAPNRHHSMVLLWFAVAWVLATLSFQLACPLHYTPLGWHLPAWMMPWVPSAGAILVLFNLGALPQQDFFKVGIYFAALLVLYLLYSLPMSYIKHNRCDYAAEDLKVVELVYSQGEWRPARLNPIHPHSHIAAHDNRLSLPLPSGLPSGLRQESNASGSSGTGSQPRVVGAPLRRPPHIEAASARRVQPSVGGRGRPRPDAAGQQQQLPQSPLKRSSAAGRLPPTAEEPGQSDSATGGT